MSKPRKKIKPLGLLSRLFGLDSVEETPQLKKVIKKKKPYKLASKRPSKTSPEVKASLAKAKKPDHWELRRKVDAVYSARPLALIGFPMAKPKARADSMHLIYRKKNGNFKVDIHGHAEFGLPFGQDELLLIAIIDYALKNDSPRVEIGSIYKILKDLGMAIGGRKYKLVQQALLRIFGSNITYWYQDGEMSGARKSSYFSVINLDILKDEDYNPSLGDFVILSDDFWRELKSHPIPYDLEVLRKLKNYIGAMKLYLWAAPRAYRISSRQGRIYVPLHELAEELGSEATKNPRKFKQNLKAWINKLDTTLFETIGTKSGIQIQEDKLVLVKSNLVPGSHRRTLILDSAHTHQTESALVTREQQTKKEFDIDWILEKEIFEFLDQSRDSLSQQASAYRAQKKKIYKGQYEDEKDLFRGN